MIERLRSIEKGVCPWWLTYTFDNPFRKFFHNPYQILGDWVKPGSIAVDIGCGMGYFSIAMAKMVGPDGKVIAVDLQNEMLKRVVFRGKKAGIAGRLQTQQCTNDNIGVSSQADFVLTFWMVHEVPNSFRFLKQIYDLLKSDGKYLLVEPLYHVRKYEFEKTVEQTLSVGFEKYASPKVTFSRALLLIKK